MAVATEVPTSVDGTIRGLGPLETTSGTFEPLGNWAGWVAGQAQHHVLGVGLVVLVGQRPDGQLVGLQLGGGRHQGHAGQVRWAPCTGGGPVETSRARVSFSASVGAGLRALGQDLADDRAVAGHVGAVHHPVVGGRWSGRGWPRWCPPAPGTVWVGTRLVEPPPRPAGQQGHHDHDGQGHQRPAPPLGRHPRRRHWAVVAAGASAGPAAQARVGVAVAVGHQVGQRGVVDHHRLVGSGGGAVSGRG